jgi:hypothetical protein
MWDESRPNWQRHCLDASRTAHLFRFRAATPFEARLRRRVNWYRSVRQEALV